MEMKKAFEHILAINIIKKSPTLQYVMFYAEVEITLVCSMSFKLFPFDQQICELNIFDRRMSSVKELQMQTVKTTLGPPFSPFESTVREFEYSLQPPLTSQVFIAEAGNNVSNTGFRLKMKRNYSKYYIMYYIPTSNKIWTIPITNLTLFSHLCDNLLDKFPDPSNSIPSKVN